MSGHEIVEIVRLVAVMALVCVAAAIATPKGRVPLALRGVLRILRKDRALLSAAQDEKQQPVSLAKRLLAFVLVLAAAVLALI